MQNHEARNLEITNLYKKGETFTNLSEKYGVTRQRIYQIIRGLTPIQYTKLKKQIFARDGRDCQWKFKCAGSFKRPETLLLHHIDGNPCNNLHDNLITLCRECHDHFHGLARIQRSHEAMMEEQNNIEHTAIFCPKCDKRITVKEVAEAPEVPVEGGFVFYHKDCPNIALHHERGCASGWIAKYSIITNACKNRKEFIN